MKITMALILIAAVTFLAGCKNDDGETPVPVNGSPESFVVTPQVKGNVVTLSWPAATDPEGDVVTYDVLLDGEKMAENISATAYTFTDLGYEKAYVGKIRASDGNDGSVEVDFTFSTGFLFLKSYEENSTEYFLEYNGEGQLVRIENEDSDDQIIRDSEGQITGLGTTSFTYNSSGPANTINDGHGEGVIQYDDQGRIAGMDAHYEYAFTSPPYYHLVTRSHIYNDKGQLIQIDEAFYNSLSADYSYHRYHLQYDSNGNVVQLKIANSADSITYHINTTVFYTYDDKKNPWYTILSGQTNFDAVFIESYGVLHSTLNFGYSSVYRTYWTSRNNLTSVHKETASGFAHRAYNYTYNEYEYPLAVEINSTYSDYAPYTGYKKWHY